jgi:peroxiredoxin
MSDSTLHGSSHEEPLPAGTPAPDFSLPVTADQRLELAELRGRPVILAFYPADWSPVCGDQMALYNQVLPEFRRLGAELVGISVDGVWCHRAFAETRNLHFPLLADFEPKGEVARPVRARRRGRHPLELPLAGRREPRRRRDPRRAGAARRAGVPFHRVRRAP